MLSLDKARWNALIPLLGELLELDAAGRADRLAQIRRDDNSLAEDLIRLLAQQSAMERAAFLKRPEPLPMLADQTLAGQVVGSYTIESPIGRGGMGTVWLARRSDGRFEARVAIKLLNLALIGSGGIDRFQREGRALARVTHHNIARLIDAGVTQAAQPYLVLEYVEGVPIDKWCELNAPDVRARIRVFFQVLSAVGHAHSNLILHRDLKPSNILVTSEGQVKLLDFGIAKLLDDRQQAPQIMELTQQGERAFTPEYAAPEQIHHGEATTATDVYALGVLLYVLLTGEHPTARTDPTSIDRLRAIVDADPPRPSDVVARSTLDANQRHSPSRQQRVRALRGDLDNIILKALKKSPPERYSTTDALAEDLRHYLNCEPVRARPDTLRYRLAKFIARNRVAVAAAAIVLITICAAVFVLLWEAREAARQRDRALTLSARNAAVADFVSGMLTEVAPADQPVRMADLLDRSESILMSSASNPEHQAAILELLADYFASSGDPAKAQVLLQRSLELTRATADDSLRAGLMCDSAYAISLLGRPADALSAIDKGLSLSNADSLAAARCLEKRAFIAQNSNDARGALEYATQARTRLRKAGLVRPDMEAGLLADIAYGHYLSGHTREADRDYAESLADLVKSGRGDSAAAFAIRNNWGIASSAAGDPCRALEQYDEAIRIASHRLGGEEPPPYLLSNRALALSTLARYPEALAAFDVAIEAGARTGNALSRIAALANRASTYVAMGEVSRADSELTGLADQVGKDIAADSVPAITILQTRARVAAARGQLAQAISGFSEVIDFFDGRNMRVAPLTRALVGRAEAYLRQGNIDAAMADGQRALQTSLTLQGDKKHSSHTGLALSLLARIHESHGQHTAALKLATEAIPHLSETLGEDHPETLRARFLLSPSAGAPSPMTSKVRTNAHSCQTGTP